MADLAMSAESPHAGWKQAPVCCHQPILSQISTRHVQQGIGSHYAANLTLPYAQCKVVKPFLHALIVERNARYSAITDTSDVHPPFAQTVSTLHLLSDLLESKNDAIYVHSRAETMTRSQHECHILPVIFAFVTSRLIMLQCRINAPPSALSTVIMVQWPGKHVQLNSLAKQLAMIGYGTSSPCIQSTQHATKLRNILSWNFH
ncbi:hypothetical protein EVG20_g9625 [Dentipellis fragilis]|uniref:Uncharacterized protein n=1 Tax=Dentipellis fragilis TaxID=205917 RepID=A0A4Y9XWK9_9AGAM|nr:hypothetical protein EVG20_g9625 [Dentipellis fragilis]